MLIPKNRQKILKTLRPLEDGSTFFFGLSDSRGEVVWRDGNTGEMANLTGITWAPGEPNNSGGKQDCINFEIETEDMYDTDCGQQFCPLCEVPEITAFNLQGICQNSSTIVMIIKILLSTNAALTVQVHLFGAETLDLEINRIMEIV